MWISLGGGEFFSIKRRCGEDFSHGTLCGEDFSHGGDMLGLYHFKAVNFIDRCFGKWSKVELGFNIWKIEIFALLSLGFSHQSWLIYFRCCSQWCFKHSH